MGLLDRLLSLTSSYPLIILPPRMPEGLGCVVGSSCKSEDCPSFDNTLNHNKYLCPLSPGKRDQNLTFCLLFAQHLPGLEIIDFYYVPPSILYSRFCVLYPSHVQMSWKALDGSNGTKHLSSDSIFFCPSSP